MRYFAIIGALALAGCLPFEEQKTIVVDGEASVEFAPEIFKISGSIRARTDNQAAALADVASMLARVRETLPQLEGLTHLSIETAEAEIVPIYNAGCVEGARYGQEGLCPVEGFFGSIKISATGSPAELSGRALSLLSELGVESVSLGSYSLLDNEKAREEAAAKAMQDARAKAEKIAEAAGATIGAPVKIQFGGGFPEMQYRGQAAAQDYLEEVVVTGTRVVAPETDLDLGPQPIKFQSKVIAAFALE